MSKQIFIIFYVFFTVIMKTIAESTQEQIFYSSTFQLQRLFDRSKTLFNKNDDYCRSNWKVTNSTLVTEHPVAAYGFIKCLYTSKKAVKYDVDESDVKGAALSLVRLQDVYDLNTEDLLRGKIHQYESNVSLHVEDCIFIAQQAFFNLQLDAAERWLQCCHNYQQSTVNNKYQSMSYHLYNNDESLQKITELQTYIKLIRQLIDGDPKSTFILQEILKIFPDFSRAALTLLTERKEILQMKNVLSTNAKLLCLKLKPEWHTIFSYHPILVEKIYKQPDIFIFHQLLNSREVEELKAAASQKLELSRTHRFGDGKIEITSARIGQMAWVSPRTNQLVKNVYRKMEIVTGLSTESAEDFQVLNYGLGGHYEVHMDFFDFNRLNDVQSGGSTVFPELGITMHPIKGSALFWRNLLLDGAGDYRTLHAACPVITGTKWGTTLTIRLLFTVMLMVIFLAAVANLWFHEKGQQTPASKRFRHIR